jgi:hypothetical protein
MQEARKRRQHAHRDDDQKRYREKRRRPPHHPGECGANRRDLERGHFGRNDGTGAGAAATAINLSKPTLSTSVAAAFFCSAIFATGMAIRLELAVAADRRVDGDFGEQRIFVILVA